MSSRHIKRLQSDKILEKSITLVLDDERVNTGSDEESDSMPVPIKNTFVFDSSDEDGDDEDVHEMPRISVNSAERKNNSNAIESKTNRVKQSHLKIKSKKKSDFMLSAPLISNHGCTRNIDSLSQFQNSNYNFNKLFRIDEKLLCIDFLMKKRFGSKILANSEPGNPKIYRHRVGNRLNKRKFIFGIPKVEWFRPPSFLAGGYSIVKCDKPADLPLNSQTAEIDGNSWYTLNLSSEYRCLNDEYQLVQNSMDANKLVLFLSKSPYHLEGLTQLAMIFAKTGHMDRAVDLIRRALYCVECAFSDDFQPTAGTGCRMDPSIPSNRAIFNIFYKHMQMCSMQGFPRVAADISIILTGLYPFDDPFHLLLTIDHFFVASNKLQDFVQWCGIGDALLDPMYWELPQILDKQWISHNVDYIRPVQDKLNDLPNWWFSAALITYNHHINSKNKLDYSFDINLPNSILQASLLKWPFMLAPLMKAAKIEGKSLLWRAVLSSDLFQNAKERLSNCNATLTLLADIYAVRNGSLWARDDVQSWLLTVCNQLLTDNSIGDIVSRVIMTQSKSFEELSSHPHCVLKHYESAVLEDYFEDFPRLPADANPLLPQFADPHILDRQRVPLNMQLHQQRNPNQMQQFDAFFNNQAVIDELNRLRVLGINVPQELIAEVGIDELRAQFGHNRAGLRENEPRRDSNIDFSAPLLQLFWQTILPWYQLGTSHRPR